MVEISHFQKDKLPPSKVKILLVEDDDDHAELFMLSARNYSAASISRAETLTDAIAIAKSQKLSLVILDLGLPETVGLDTLSLFLQSCSSTPVMVLTAIVDLNLGEEALKLGAMDFLSKEEITPRTLLRSIRYALERWSQKRKLEDSLADLQYFGSMAAHDLVSPLDAIHGFSQLIELELSKGKITEEALECLDLLKKSAQRSIVLVRDLQKLSSLGRKSIERKELDINTIVKDVCSNLSKLISETKGTVEASEVLPIRGDAGLVYHVMQNLIANGLKYGRDDVPPHVRVSSCIEEDYTVICVEDNGIGIDESDSTRIFLPFERLTGASDKKGSGLGLSICKKIVEAHNGEIWIESTEGAGTRFYFHLGS
ncbi:ATP-binding protein [Pelagicoccus sp. SDUM812002]|nr:ATP-binding protein [Pelagicoccus sp. SDUM812002]